MNGGNEENERTSKTGQTQLGIPLFAAVDSNTGTNMSKCVRLCVGEGSEIWLIECDFLSGAMVPTLPSADLAEGGQIFTFRTISGADGSKGLFFFWNTHLGKVW